MDTSNVTIKILAKVDTPVISPSMKPNELADALREKYKQFRVSRKQVVEGV